MARKPRQNVTPAVRGVNPSTGHKNIVTDAQRQRLTSTLAVRGRQSKCWTQEHREGCPEKVANIDAGSPGRQSKYWTQEHRDGCPEKVANIDAGSPGRQSKYWTQEHRDGCPEKVANIDAGSPGRQSKYWDTRTS